MKLSIAVYAFVVRTLTSLSVDEILLPKYINWSTNFRDLPLRTEMAPCFKHKNSVLFSCSCTSQCVQLFALGYAKDVWFGQVYLREAPYHLRSLYLS